VSGLRAGNAHGLAIYPTFYTGDEAAHGSRYVVVVHDMVEEHDEAGFALAAVLVMGATSAYVVADAASRGHRASPCGCGWSSHCSPLRAQRRGPNSVLGGQSFTIRRSY
jgi:hypothetical protein